LVLGTDSFGRTAWHVAEHWGKLEVFHTIWDWGEKNLTTEEIKN